MSPPLRRRSPSSLKGCKRIQLINHKTAEESRNVRQDVYLFCNCFTAFHSRVFTKSRALQICVRWQFKHLMAPLPNNSRWEKKTLRYLVSLSVFFYIESKPRSPNTCLADSGVCTRANEPAFVRASHVWAAHRAQRQPPKFTLFTVHTGSKMTEMCIRRNKHDIYFIYTLNLQ